MANSKTDKLKEKLALGIEPSHEEMNEAEKEQKQRNSSLNSITKQRDSWVAIISELRRMAQNMLNDFRPKKLTVQSDEPKTTTTQSQVPQPRFNALDQLREKALNLVGKFKVLFAKLTENLVKYTQLSVQRQAVQQKQTSVVQQVVNVINNALGLNQLPQLNQQQAQQMQNALNMALQYGQQNNTNNNPNNNQATQYLQVLQQQNPNAHYLIIERINADYEAYNIQMSDGSKIDDRDLGKILGKMPHLGQGVMFVKQLYEMRPELKDSDENEHMVNTGFDLFKDNNLGVQYNNLQTEQDDCTRQMNVYENEINQEHKELKELIAEMNGIPQEFVDPSCQRNFEKVGSKMSEVGLNPEVNETSTSYSKH